MRVTQNTSANQVLASLQTILKRQQTLQQQAATGVKVNNPGDDPVATQQILHLKSLSAASDQFTRNITNGTSTLTVVESAMSSMGDVLVRAKELAIAMSSDTNNAQSRAAAAKEFEQLRSQFISLGNTEFNGKFVFGGFKNDTAPFNATTGAFSGTNDDLKVEIARDSFVSTTYSGETLVSGGTPPGSTGVDIVGIFDNIATALAAGNSAGVRAELGKIDDAQEQVMAGRAEIGARMNRLTSASSVNDDMKLSITQVVAGLQDVDYAQVISDLTKQENAFQTAVAASAKISQVSLLDYLR